MDLKTKLSCIIFNVGLDPKMGVLLRDKKGKDTKEHKDSCIKTKAETGVTQPQVKGWIPRVAKSDQKPNEMKENSSLKPSAGARPGFQTSGSHTV